jgi:hypothetical protein
MAQAVIPHSQTPIESGYFPGHLCKICRFKNWPEDRVYSRYFRFPLSASFHHCTVVILFWLLHLSEGQAGRCMRRLRNSPSFYGIGRFIIDCVYNISLSEGQAGRCMQTLRNSPSLYGIGRFIIDCVCNISLLKHTVCPNPHITSLICCNKNSHILA